MIGRGPSHDAQSFDDAWTSRGRTRLDGEIADLVRSAELLCRSAVAEPSTDFRSSLRARLMTEAADVLVAEPAPVAAAPVRSTAPVHSTARRRRLTGLAAAVVTGVGAVGMVSSSATAVPGDILYPVKRGVESVQLAMHRDDTSRGEYQLTQASERLAEAWYLDTNDHDDRVAAALDDFAEQATAGSTRLFDAFGANGSDADIDTVTDFTAASTVTLTKMSDDLPADAQASLDAAAETLTGLASQATALCTSCDATDVSALVDAVEDAAGQSTPGRQPAPGGTSTDDTTPGTGSGAEPSAPTTRAPITGGNVPALPQPTSAPRLPDLTEPLVGDDGLVPGLVDGLLGSKK